MTGHSTSAAVWTVHNTTPVPSTITTLMRVCTRSNQNSEMCSYLKSKEKLQLHRLLSSFKRFVWAYRSRSGEWMLLMGSECWWWPTRPAADCGSAAENDSIHFLGWWLSSSAAGSQSEGGIASSEAGQSKPCSFWFSGLHLQYQQTRTTNRAGLNSLEFSPVVAK